MKILTAQEYVSLQSQFKKKGPKTVKGGQFVKAIQSLNLGEILLIESSDWKLKSSPSTYLHAYKKNKKFKTSSLLDGKGWIITRIK